MASSSRRRPRPSSPSPVSAHPLEDDDLLHEIMLRLPPQPPYLLRTSIVSKRWRLLATDPKFLRRFRIHHRNPPLLGVFSCTMGDISFRSTLDPPIPPERFSLSPSIRSSQMCLDVRHGRVLIDDGMRSRVIVWDPITDDRRVVGFPPQFSHTGIHSGAVLCAAGDKGHVHGACHSGPFKVVAIISDEHDDDLSDEDDDYKPVVLASVYSSETGMWSDLISTTIPGRGINLSLRSTLVGNTLSWLVNSPFMLEFDLETHILAVTRRPRGAHRGDKVQIIQAEDGGIGIAALFGSDPSLQMWDRKVDSQGLATWVLRKSLELQNILGLESRIEDGNSSILHYVEDGKAILLRVRSSVYMVRLESLQSKKLFKSSQKRIYRPFTSFLTEGVFSNLKQKQPISG
ncbi:hypothetical protein QYE76_056742 [Lolium multiflorum]|uniref:F-box domain-containing protein n=1 Tax=Lolium multiflorum TaxID=4521 RepID=A0AAD8T3Z5_LOLMU|nr:hypothetical protein QYE76_056742 [Lolium multiflorum]